jgi:hypothetical protein
MIPTFSNFILERPITAFDSDNVKFIFNDSLVEIYFEWNSNEGEKWSFTTTLIHPDIDYSLNESGNIDSSIKELLSDMAEELEIQKDFIKPLSLEILKIAKPLYENHPVSSPSDSYYGT